jgi:universal stress protein A
MEMVKKILAPTDLSHFSAKGVRYACNLAKALGAEVIVAHVVNSAEFIADARRLGFASVKVESDNLLVRLIEQHKQLLRKFMDEHLSELRTDLTIQQVVEMGEAHSLLVEWAKAQAVDLIVMSTHGRSGLPRMLIGSVTERVLRRSPCPVLAIPSHEE